MDCPPVLWPSRRQPIETFQARGTWQMSYPEGNPYQGNPWSYFINTDSAKVDTSTLKVTLECDGKPTDVLDLNKAHSSRKVREPSVYHRQQPTQCGLSPSALCGYGSRR